MLKETSIEASDLKKLMKELLAEIISEAEEPFLPDDEEDETENKIGLYECGDFFSIAGDFCYELDGLLSFQGYQLDSARAYHLLADLFEGGIYHGWFKEDAKWDELIEKLHERGDKMVGVDEPVQLPHIVFNPYALTNLIAALVRSWDPQPYYSNDNVQTMEELDIAGRLIQIRGFLVALSHKGILDRQWPWVLNLFEDMLKLIYVNRPVPGASGTIPGASHA